MSQSNKQNNSVAAPNSDLPFPIIAADFINTVTAATFWPDAFWMEHSNEKETKNK